jgi:hypothetical protein
MAGLEVVVDPNAIRCFETGLLCQFIARLHAQPCYQRVKGLPHAPSESRTCQRFVRSTASNQHPR